MSLWLPSMRSHRIWPNSLYANDLFLLAISASEQRKLNGDLPHESKEKDEI